MIEEYVHKIITSKPLKNKEGYFCNIETNGTIFWITITQYERNETNKDSAAEVVEQFASFEEANRYFRDIEKPKK